MANQQIYSATYSNVPVFEYVTDEGPIMRRKADSWINATHILKIAKFPKAKRTRILEKDVQTGVHEKVQGGYGKYQGTYVPLELGVDLAKSFDVYDELKPIFDFKYVEGKAETPPPAPKHSHASASNVAARQNSDLPPRARKSKSTTSITEPPRKRGRPKRLALNEPPKLKYSDTTPLDTRQSGPNIGTFRKSFTASQGPPSFQRQDTEQDAVNLMANNMHVKEEDIEVVDKSSDDERLDDNEDDGLMSGKELFGTPRNSFERIVQSHNSQSHHDPYGLSQYHHPHQNNQLQSFKDDSIHSEYFGNLLNFFLEDSGSSQNVSSSSNERNDNGSSSKTSKSRSHETVIPEKLLNPPRPLSKINISQPIDNDGNTIFHWACSMANKTIIEFLINEFPNNINPNMKNNNGETPLMFLVKFSNSYQLKNFSELLELLFDSLLTVDNLNKTVLHHIAMTASPPGLNHEVSFNGNDESQLQNYLKNKERVARYYIECVFTRVVEYQNYSNVVSLRGNLMRKFVNHQDSDGNTAFHIIAYNLNKKLIKIFISYHKYIDFGLKNLVNYTVEEYLASHNFILRLENQDSQDSIKSSITLDAEKLGPKSFNLQSFESQLYYTKMAINMTNSTSNMITEKLTELAFAIDKEMNEKDEKMLKLINIGQAFNKDKLAEQQAILKIFKLDYLTKDAGHEADGSNVSKDKIIQDEINRLANDLTFQILQKKDKLEKRLEVYKKFSNKANSERLLQLESSFKDKNPAGEAEKNYPDSATHASKVRLAAELQEQIIKSHELSTELHKLQLKVPPSVTSTEEFKENAAETKFPFDEKFNKYCKLIAVCCGMNINEVENSIDSIEQSLMKSMSTK